MEPLRQSLASEHCQSLKLIHLATQIWISPVTPPLFAGVLAICGNRLAKLGGKNGFSPGHLLVVMGYSAYGNERYDLQFVRIGSAPSDAYDFRDQASYLGKTKSYNSNILVRQSTVLF